VRVNAAARHTAVALAAFLAAGPALAQPFGLSRAAFRANTYATGDQRRPAVAVDSTGAFLIVWNDAGLDGNGSGIFAKRYTNQGTPIGAFNIEFQLNTYTTGAQYGPAVAAIGTGTYVVAWTSTGQDNSGNEVYAQRWGTTGMLGAEFRVNTETFASQAYPAVAVDGTGNFVIAWRDDGYVGAQRFSSAGARQGAAYRTGSGQASLVTVARSSGGDFVIAWFDGADYSNVHGQRYSATGAPAGAEFVLNNFGGTDYTRPITSAWGPNGFVVAWGLEGASAGQYNVWAARFSPAGAPIGVEYRLNTLTGNARDPEIAMDSTGAFVVAWTAYPGATLEAFARRFTAAGAPIGAEFRVNTYTTGNQAVPAIATSPSGRFMIAWQSQLEDGHGYGIFAQAACQHLAGDATGNGAIDISDVFYLINNLFAGGPAPVHNGDANGDGTVDISDVFYLINYLFAGGPGPACA
jgi:hypothetical protein